VFDAWVVLVCFFLPSPAPLLHLPSRVVSGGTNRFGQEGKPGLGLPVPISTPSQSRLIVYHPKRLRPFPSSFHFAGGTPDRVAAYCPWSSVGAFLSSYVIPPFFPHSEETVSSHLLERAFDPLSPVFVFFFFCFFFFFFGCVWFFCLLFFFFFFFFFFFLLCFFFFFFFFGRWFARRAPFFKGVGSSGLLSCRQFLTRLFLFFLSFPQGLFSAREAVLFLITSWGLQGHFRAAPTFHPAHARWPCVPTASCQFPYLPFGAVHLLSLFLSVVLRTT